MPKRTIGEAQQVLDGLLLAPSDRRDREEELEGVRLRFTERLDQDHDRRHEVLTGQIERLEAGLIEVARDLHRLRKDADSLTAREYRVRYDKAMARKADLQRKSEDIRHAVKQLRAEERNPERTIDQMLERYPALKPRFSF